MATFELARARLKTKQMQMALKKENMAKVLKMSRPWSSMLVDPSLRATGKSQVLWLDPRLWVLVVLQLMPQLWEEPKFKARKVQNRSFRAKQSKKHLRKIVRIFNENRDHKGEQPVVQFYSKNKLKIKTKASNNKLFLTSTWFNSHHMKDSSNMLHLANTQSKIKM